MDIELIKNEFELRAKELLPVKKASKVGALNKLTDMLDRTKEAEAFTQKCNIVINEILDKYNVTANQAKDANIVGHITPIIKKLIVDYIKF